MILNNYQQEKVPNFQKQYTRLYYDHHELLKSKKTINFTQPIEPCSFPTIFMDTMREDVCVYLLSWKQNEFAKILLIRNVKEQRWVKVCMNSWPSRLAITDDHAFIFGGKELFILGLNCEESKSIKLEDAKIIDLKLCYTESKEPGVYIIYFNNKVGYFTKEYSKSTSNSLWGQLKSIIRSITLKKNQQFDWFQTILPNLVGIALIGKQLVLYDMNKVMATTLQVPFDSQLLEKTPMIRWIFKQSSKGLKEAIHIFILTGKQILEYAFHIARIEANAEIESKDNNISIQFIARGTVIDWTKSIFQKCAFEVNSQFRITNFQVNHQQLIYREEIGSLTQIPILHRISLLDFQTTQTIISQQSAVWHQYYKNPSNSAHFLAKFSHQIQQDTCLKSKEIGFGKKIWKIESDSLIYLNKWRKNNKFQSFFIHNDQIYIARAQAITSFQKIPQLQYELENYTEADRLRDEELKIGNLLKQCNKLANIGQETIIKEYKRILAQLKGYVELIHNITNERRGECQMSKSKLFINILRDQIAYYHHIFSFTISELQFEEKSYKNNQIIRFITYLKTSFESQNQHTSIGKSFIQLFVHKIQNELTVVNQINFIIFFKKLLKKLLPESFIAQSKSQRSLETNQYLEFLVNFMLVSQDEDLTLTTQQQLKKIIAHVYPTTDDQTHPSIIANISFVKAYLLSHPTDADLLPFSRQLINTINYRQIIDNLKQIFHLIPNQIDLLIKTEISLKKNKISSQIFGSSSLMYLANPVSGKKRGFVELAQQILLAQCSTASQQQKHESDLKAVQASLLDLSNADVVGYHEIERKLIKICEERMKSADLFEDYAKILQIQEILLKGFTNILNHRLQTADSVEPTKLPNYQIFLDKIIGQIQLAFFTYKKYFKKLYDFEKRDAIGGINLEEISRRVNEEESLMSSSFMDSSIKIQSHHLNSIFISLLKRIAASDSLLKLSCKHQFDFRFDDYVDEIFKEMMSVRIIGNEEMDFLYYVLLKKGQKYFKRVLARGESHTPHKIIKYFEKSEVRDVLYRLVCDIVGDSNRSVKDSFFKKSE